jgi:hypothetical protein
MPFVTWTLTIGLMRLHLWPKPSLKLVWPAPLALVVMIVAASRLAKRCEVPKTYAGPSERRRFLYDDNSQRRSTLHILSVHPALWCGATLVVAAITVAAFVELTRPSLGGRVIAPTLAAAALSAAAGWAWWRISWTYREYLLMAGLPSETRTIRPE